MYHQYNFHKHTFCLFQQVDHSIVANLKLGYKSCSGSEYFFTEMGVYRKSNHWGRAANCRWRLITNTEYKNQTEIIGFAKWTQFYSNNETEKLFYIDLNDNEISFNHKDSDKYNGQFLRNAAQTSKRIKEIKVILQTETWAKYLNFNNYEELKLKILSDLINTNESFVNLKTKLNNKY